MDNNYLIIGTRTPLVLQFLQLLSCEMHVFFIDVPDNQLYRNGVSIDQPNPSATLGAMVDACHARFQECWIFDPGLADARMSSRIDQELREADHAIMKDIRYVSASCPSGGFQWVRQPCWLIDEDTQSLVSSGLSEELYRLRMEMEKKAPGYWAQHDLPVSERFRSMSFAISTVQSFTKHLSTLVGKGDHLPPHPDSERANVPLAVALEKILQVKVTFNYGEPAEGLADLIDRILDYYSDEGSQEKEEKIISAATAPLFEVCLPVIAAHLEKSHQYWSGNDPDPLSGMQKTTIQGHHGNIIHYFTGGEGRETLLIINALGLSIRFWNASISHLMRAFRVIVWETRCCDLLAGGMEKVVTIDEHVADLAAIIEHEQAGPCHLIGWCNGGRIAISAGAAFPSMIASLVLLCPVFRGIREFDADDTPFERDQQEVFNSVTKTPKVAGLLASYLVKTNAKPPDAGGPVGQLLSLPDADCRRDIIAPMSTGDYLINYARRTFNDEHYPIGQLMRLVRQPVLMILGREDAVISNKLALAAAGLLPNCRTMSLRAASHYIQLQQPDILAGLIYDFIISRKNNHTSPRWD